MAANNAMSKAMLETLESRIEKKIHREIPLSNSLHIGFQILELSPGKTVTEIPLKGNTNHLGTQFGGSLFSGAALTCYSTLLGFLERQGIIDAKIVVVDAAIRYLNPGNTDLRFEVQVNHADFQNFFKVLSRDSRAKIQIECSARNKGRPEEVVTVQASYLVKLAREA